MGRRVLTIVPNATATLSRYNALLDFSASSEALKSSGNETIGVSNSWTVWTGRFFKTVAALGWFDFKNTGSNNDRIVLDQAASNTCRARLWDSAGTAFKNYTYSPTLEAGRWFSAALSWDGTTMTLYLNGAAQTATTLTTDLAGTMSTGTRQVSTGLTASNNDPNAMWCGLAVWNTALSAANMAYITDPNNFMTDWKKDVDTYTGSGNLVHQWRPIAVRGNQSGTTYVADDIPGVGIDISAGSVGIDNTDLTTSDDDLPYKATNNHCIEFNGTDEYIQTAVSTTIGIVGAYTVKITAKSLRDTADETLFHIAPSGANTNAFKIAKLGTVANDPMVVYVYSSTATLLKEYRFNNALPVGVWKSYTFAWEQTGDTLTVYDQNGNTMTADSKPTDGAGSTTSTSRLISFGADVGGGSYFYGRIRAVGIWSTNLSSSQVGDIAASGTHLMKVGTNYTPTQLALLERWFLLGKTVPPSGYANGGTAYIYDLGNNSTTLDLSGGSGVDTSNIVVTDPVT